MSTSASQATEQSISPTWWQEAIIYQVYPRSYLDTNGDGVGDLNGITDRLDYIAQAGRGHRLDLAVLQVADEGLRLRHRRLLRRRPAVRHPGRLRPADRQGARGGREDHDRPGDEPLLGAAPVVRESRSSRDNPKADWFVWADPLPDGNPPNNWLSVFGGSAWQWDARRKQYYMHNFLTSQPDLNFHNPEVQQAMLDSLRFWLQRGVDGVRLDAVTFHFHDRNCAAIRPPPCATRPP
jgi:alpha-glucosidase